MAERSALSIVEGSKRIENSLISPTSDSNKRDRLQMIRKRIKTELRDDKNSISKMKN